jgi:MoxR-like ATPase
MAYQKLFDPARPSGDVLLEQEVTTRSLGDRRDGQVYVMTDEITLSVNVALATGRPLLVQGPPGSGKSSLAAYAARVLGWRYYEHVVSSRTVARDLLWHFDAVRRLSDAQLGSLGGRETYNEHRYVSPRALWWAFDPAGAAQQGEAFVPDAMPLSVGIPAVVLVDEIDKADPDIPNDLLVPIGSLTFTVTETDTVVQARAEMAPLVVITTNGERDLPNAFLRRCIMLSLCEHSQEMLVEIGSAHLGAELAETHRPLLEALAEAIVGLRNEASERGALAPSTAEYLDAVRACITLDVVPGSDGWSMIEDVALAKFRLIGELR